MGLIDVHCHFMPDGFPPCACASAADRWPWVRREGVVDAVLEIGGKPFRKVDSRSWDLSRRLADMDAAGVSIQVLSPMPELLSYWLDPSATTQLCEHVNGLIGSGVTQTPDRFRGLGMVPLQDPDRAVAMLEDLRPKFGLCGVEIGSNIDGMALGDPRFAPFWAAAEALDLCVFVHALHPLVSRGSPLPQSATPMVGFPVDTALAAVSLIYGGVRERHPRLRIGFSHGGGALAPLLHRLEHGWSITGGFEGTMALSPKAQAATFYYDNLVYDPGYARHLAETVAPGQVFAGTDYPYVLMQSDPAGFVDDCGLDVDAADAMLAGAAARFLDASCSAWLPLAGLPNLFT